MKPQLTSVIVPILGSSEEESFLKIKLGFINTHHKIISPTDAPKPHIHHIILLFQSIVLIHKYFSSIDARFYTELIDSMQKIKIKTNLEIKAEQDQLIDYYKKSIMILAMAINAEAERN